MDIIVCEIRYGNLDANLFGRASIIIPARWIKASVFFCWGVKWLKANAKGSRIEVKLLLFRLVLNVGYSVFVRCGMVLITGKRADRNGILNLKNETRFGKASCPLESRSRGERSFEVCRVRRWPVFRISRLCQM